MKKMSVLLIIVSFVMFSACSKGGGEMAAAPDAEKYVKNEKTGNDRFEKSVEAAEVPVSGKLVRSGNMNIRFDDIDRGVDAVSRTVKNHGGYIAQSNIDARSANLTIKIPSEKFDAFISEIKGHGKVIQLSVSTEDVTLKYYDLEGRIKAKRIVQSRISGYLNNARNIDEMLKLEKELGNVTEGIESVESQMKSLKNDVSYSTLTIFATLPDYGTYKEAIPSFVEGFLPIVFAFVTFIYYLLYVVFAVVLFGVPLLLLTVGFIYIGFGKIGLIRKLFKKAF